MNLGAVIMAVVAFIATTPSQAIDSLCEAVALRDAPATNTTSEVRKGMKIDAITQYVVNKKSGAARFCTRVGGCYSANALRLVNCVIDKNYGDDFGGDETLYRLGLIRSKINPDRLRQYDVELKLLDLGMCAGCADNAAAFYAKKAVLALCGPSQACSGG
jgi:hypothetical protein